MKKQIIKNQKIDPFVEIIEYNTKRLYFGLWTPAQISAIYKENKKKESNRTTSLNTGIISVDDICDSLWNEMSYNPERFGNKSPFLFNGINSIQQFCNNHIFYEKTTNDKDIVFHQISNLLKEFMDLMNKQSPDFSVLGCTLTPIMEVGLDEYVDYSNDGYKILAKIRDCIKTICIQNVNDYKNSEKHNAKIREVISQRHPSMVRPLKIPNYRLIGPIASLKPDLEKINSKIIAKEEEIERIQMRISTLEDMEAPGDTSQEYALLAAKERDLEKLEQQYNDKQNKLKALGLSHPRQRGQ